MFDARDEAVQYVDRAFHVSDEDLTIAELSPADILREERAGRVNLWQIATIALRAGGHAACRGTQSIRTEWPAAHVAIQPADVVYAPPSHDLLLAPDPEPNASAMDLESLLAAFDKPKQAAETDDAVLFQALET